MNAFDIFIADFSVHMPVEHIKEDKKMEKFESVMDNISELEVKCYEDPVEGTYNLEILVKSGEEEYVYKFKGPGVRVANFPMFDEWINLAKDNEKLKQENKKLKEAYEKLKQEKSKIPMVDDCLKLTKEIEKLTFENAMLKKGNDKLKKENEKLISKNEIELLSKYHDPCDHCVYSDVDVSNEPCFSCDHFNKFEKSSFDQVKRDEEVEPITRADILDQAKKCVCGQREQDYGTPESNFQLIADLWNGYLGFMYHPQDQIRATDVAMLMALMKIARIRNGGGSGDSFVDLAGYAACGGEIWNGERH